MPVRRDDWPAIDVPSFFQVVGDEVLQRHLIHRGAVRGTGNGPDIVDQESECPVPRLNEGDDRWAEAQLALAESCAGRGWEDHRGPDTPDEFSGLCGREKEGWAHVAEAVLASGGLSAGRLPHDRLNDSRDQHPVFADASGDDGLDVEYVLGAVIWPDGKVRIVLKGNADEAGYWVLRRFGKCVCVVCCCGGCGCCLSLCSGACGSVLRR